MGIFIINYQTSQSIVEIINNYAQKEGSDIFINIYLFIGTSIFKGFYYGHLEQKLYIDKWYWNYN
jgi:hypothetical protein